MPTHAKTEARIYVVILLSAICHLHLATSVMVTIATTNVRATLLAELAR